MSAPLLASTPVAAPAHAAPSTPHTPSSTVPSTASVLRRDVPWDTYAAANLLTEGDVSALRKLDRSVKARRATGGAPRTPGAPPTPDELAGAAAALAVVRSVTKEETVQYVLALLDEDVKGEAARAGALLVGARTPDAPSATTLLLRALQRPDWFSQERAANLLAALLAGGEGDDSVASPSSALPPFLDFILSQLRRPTNANRSLPVATSALARLLRQPAARVAAARAGAPALLVPVLRKAAASGAPQAAYDASISAWLLALTPAGADGLEGGGAVPALVDVLRTATKEKVVRAASLALGALMAAPGATGPAAGGAAVTAGASRTLDALLAQSFDDDDVVEALTSVKDAVTAATDAAASWDSYRAEILSGRLSWSPAHTSNAFWAAHASRLEDRDAQLLRVLVRLLDGGAAGGDTRTLAVACSDLARYAGAVPHARGVLNAIGAKDAAVRLLAHADPDVRRHALAAVQGMVLSRDRLQYLNA